VEHRIQSIFALWGLKLEALSTAVCYFGYTLFIFGNNNHFFIYATMQNILCKMFAKTYFNGGFTVKV
jgi:hypothetical protein